MERWLSLKLRYRIIAFVSGFSLLAYELAGARILAPVVGSSTYVWTSIIGVIIAALSLGYFLGGWLADKRCRQLDVVWLLLGSAGGIFVTLLLTEPVLSFLSLTQFDVRIQALLASFILFAPASVILGALSPYLVRLHTHSIKEAGRSVAALSALNSLGGIIGTFLVGFIFFGFIGSRQTLLVIILLLIFASFLLVSKELLQSQLKIFLILPVVSVFAMVSSGTDSSVVAQLETPSSMYQVRDIIYNNKEVRVLIMGPGGFQSGIYKDGSQDLVFGYTQAMARGVKLHQNPKNILVLGGGTFTIPEYLSRQHPNAQIDVVEIDPKLKDIAVEYFSYSEPENIEIISEDARTYVNNTNRRYDVILVDAFSDTGIPFTVTTREFANEVSNILQLNGALLMNVIAGDDPACRPLLRSIYSSFRNEMDGLVSPVQRSSLEGRQNIMLALTKENNSWLQAFGGQDISTQDSTNLSDNYAPIERLHQNCLNG